MDKDRAHKLAKLAGVTVPRPFLLEQGFPGESPQTGRFPGVSPLCQAGESRVFPHGVAKVSKREKPAPRRLKLHLPTTMKRSLKRLSRALRWGCAIMGNREPSPGKSTKWNMADGFFLTSPKNNLITSKIHVPARISPENPENQGNGKTIYRALDCRGFARWTFFDPPAGEIVFNEVNTIPRIYRSQPVSSMMEAAGMPLKEAVTKAIELAVEP